MEGENRARKGSQWPSPPVGKILVVDDDEVIHEMVRRMFHALGYEAACAADGREGAEYYREHKDEVGLILLDMQMPVIGGHECFRQLLRIDPGVKVILSTGNTREGAVQQVLDEGALGLLMKPYVVTQLAEVLERALGEPPSRGPIHRDLAREGGSGWKGT
jgi:CheY-like chemotaxis protein